MTSPGHPWQNSRVYPTHEGKTIFPQHEKAYPTRELQSTFLWLLGVLLAPYPLWLTFIKASLAYEITIIFNLILTLTFTFAAILCWHYIWRLLRVRNMPYKDQIKPSLVSRISHILILSTFDEPVELLLETIQTAAEQTVAKSIVMVVGMEERTPEREMKMRIITKRFGSSFKGLTFSVHPFLTNGEIPGPSSSNNYAARAAVKYMIENKILTVDKETNEVDLDYSTVTICKPDTTFSHLYFACLTHAFLKEDLESRYHLCWQSPLFYSIASDKHCFFTRVMDILCSFFIIGFLVGYSINTTAIYSTSLRLIVKCKYFHPRYQMDDIMFTAVALNYTGKRIKIRRLDVPTLTTSTSASTLYSELEDWVDKAARQANGAAEAFHYLSVKNFCAKFTISGVLTFSAFLYFYVFVLCFSGLTQMTTFLIQLVGLGVPAISINNARPFQSWFNFPDAFPFQWILPSLVLFTYLMVFSTAFAVEKVVRNTLGRPEKLSQLRNILHFLTSQLILWAYCSIQFFSILSIALFGKKVYGYFDMKISEETIKTTEKIWYIPFHKSAVSESSGSSESSCSSSDISLDLDIHHNSKHNDAMERDYSHGVFHGSDSFTSTSTESARAVLQHDVQNGKKLVSDSHHISSGHLTTSNDQYILETQKTIMNIGLHEPSSVSNDVVISIDDEKIVVDSLFNEEQQHSLNLSANRSHSCQSTEHIENKTKIKIATKLNKDIQNTGAVFAFRSFMESNQQECALKNTSTLNSKPEPVADLHKSTNSSHEDSKNKALQSLEHLSSKTRN